MSAIAHNEVRPSTRTDKFKVGDVVVSLVNRKFLAGKNHVIGGKYIVTAKTLAYYNVNHEDYELDNSQS